MELDNKSYNFSTGAFEYTYPPPKPETKAELELENPLALHPFS